MTAERVESYGEKARQWMVDAQLATNKITHPAIQRAFLSIPREAFVPAPFVSNAYVDEPIPLGEGRYMVEPMVLATWLQALNLKGDERLLIIGGNLGYAAAVSAPLVADVTLADDASFATHAQKALSNAGLGNVTVTGTLSEGAPDRAPYDVIMVEGAMEMVPEGVLSQLSEGGRMVYAEPIGSHGHMARLLLAEYRHASLAKTSLGEAPVPRLAAFIAPKGFEFA